MVIDCMTCDYIQKSQTADARWPQALSKKVQCIPELQRSFVGIIYIFQERRQA